MEDANVAAPLNSPNNVCKQHHKSYQYFKPPSMHVPTVRLLCTHALYLAPFFPDSFHHLPSSNQHRTLGIGCSVSSTTDTPKHTGQHQAQHSATRCHRPHQGAQASTRHNKGHMVLPTAHKAQHSATRCHRPHQGAQARNRHNKGHMVLQTAPSRHK